MNARVAQAINLYSAIEHMKLRMESMGADLQMYVNGFDELLMGEYIEASERIDRRVERKRYPETLRE